jgi:hypothetical protein
MLAVTRNFKVHCAIKIIDLSLSFSQKVYVCFDFLSQHHNIIRYQHRIAVIKDDFHTACSWVQFKNKESWKYDLFLHKKLHAFICYVASMESFYCQTIHNQSLILRELKVL